MNFIELQYVKYYLLETLSLMRSGELTFEGWVEFFLFTEIIFLILITLSSFIVRYYRDIKKYFVVRYMARAHKKVERVLLADNAPVAPILSRIERRAEIIVPVLERLDLYHRSRRWDLLKKNIIANYLRTQAITSIKKMSWKKRNLALRIFLLDLHSFPPEIIIKGLDDPLPLNQMHAALCVGKLGTKEAVNALINQLVHTGRFGRFAFEDALLQGNPDVLFWVKERYEKESSALVRRVCLEVLSRRVGLSLTNELLKDLKSSEMELRLAAIRALGNQPSEIAIDALIGQLGDPIWVVRATAAKSLGRIGDSKSAPHLIRGLRDREWWVRMNSAVSLNQMGKLGRQMLELQDPDVDPYAYDIAQYVLALGETNV